MNRSKMSPYQEFIYKRTYARWLDDKGRRENWNETVERYADYFRKRVPEELLEDFMEAINSVYTLDVMPSMRALWTAGVPLELENVSGYNCAYTVVESPRDLAEILYILMCGTGVGFSTERQYINRLPEVPQLLLKSSHPPIVIEDSRRGWAEGYLKFLESLYYDGIIPQVDYSKIRPKGAKLKTFGGRASGPEPLKQLFDFTEKVFIEAAGRKLNSLEVYDIVCMIASCVVAGGVRRSATLNLSNLSDSRMRRAKEGQFWLENPQRALSNNSVAYTEKPDIGIFMEEWMALMKSGTGERGIVNREALKKSARRVGRDPEHDFGVNPCFTGDMRLLTHEGYRTFEELEGKAPFLVNYNGNISKGAVWCSGEKETIEVKLHDKTTFRCTPDHVFMLEDGSECEAKDLKGKKLKPFLNQGPYLPEFVRYGFIQGDGCLGRLASDKHLGLEVNIGENDDDIKTLFGIKEMEGREYYLQGYNETLRELGFSSETLPERLLPSTINEWSLWEQRSFLRGLYSANGSVLSNGRITLKSTCRPMLEQVGGLLNKLGIEWYITTNKSKPVEFSNGAYVCRESYDLNIQKFQSRVLFHNLINFEHRYKQEKLYETIIKTNPAVRSVKPTGKVEKVYDFHEPETHWGIVEGYVVHNCGEIILRPRQFCNLTEVVVRPWDTYGTLAKKVVHAVILGILQSTLTEFNFLSDEWKRNVSEERLLGVSLTGLKDHPILSRATDEASRWLENMRWRARAVAEYWANALGINVPKAVTTVKPSGTVSQLVDSSSGMHPRHARHYIRRVRVATTDPLASFLMSEGVPWKPEVGQTEDDMTTVVFEFPIKAPEGGVFRGEETALEQLEYWKMLKERWTDHNPSQTIYVKEDEWLAVGAWVYENFDIIGGLSFLPYDGGVYQLAPYEEITEEQYEKLLEAMPSKIDWEALAKYEKGDNTQGAREFACVGDRCEIL